MNSHRALAIMRADVCVPDHEPTDTPGPSHLVLPGGARVCDGRVMVAPVLADSEVPGCHRCQRANDAAQRRHDRHEARQ